MPGTNPSVITASLPSAVTTRTACERTVPVSGSYTHTAVVAPSWRNAVVGSLMAGKPARLSAAGVTCTVAPRGGAWAASMLALTAKVRVTGSALAATSRT